MTQIAQLQLIEDSELDTLSIIFRENPNAKIVKYSPHKRCLLQIEKDGKEFFVKIYPKKFLKRERGEKIHEIGEKLWQFAEEKRINFCVPKSVFWCKKTRAVWQEKFAGEQFTATRGGTKIAFEIGAGVAIISKLEIVPPRFFDRQEQIKDSHEFAEKIEKFAPYLNAKIDRFFNLAENAKLPTEKLVPIHGDMHIDQWLYDGKQLALLDFEDFSLGEAERDLASFIVQIKVEYPHLDKEFIESFLAGFRSNNFKENERLMKFYAAHKWLAKAAKDEAEAEKRLDKALKNLELLG